VGQRENTFVFYFEEGPMFPQKIDLEKLKVSLLQKTLGAPPNLLMEATIGNVTIDGLY